ncbi:MAG: lysine--tRNA ligase [Dehalococcoidia bacterium]|nr:lysine--tRNA ligase [Dehalococcoidia bacterium]
MTSRLERITEQRLDSLSRIRARGIDPYPHSYHPSHTIREAITLFEQQGESSQDISLAGRIMSKRSIGKMSFLDIRDSSGKIQLSLRYDLLGRERYEFLQDIDIGDIIGAKGKLFRTKAGELTLGVSDFAMLCKSLRPLPEKWHGLSDVEKRYRQRYLDLISNEESKSIFILRSKIITAIRSFLDKQGFMEVETPVLQPHAGGALARPFVTHHHALDADLYLRIALELHLKRLVVGGFDKVYEMGRAFRNEGISVRHNPEFTLLECYQAYSDYNDMMRLVEEMVVHISQEVLGNTKLARNGKTIDLGLPWQKLYLREAIKNYCGIDFEDYPDAASLRTRMAELDMDVDPTKGKGRLIEELISTFVEPNLVQPTFLLDYPVEMSPLAKRKRGDDHLVERFEGFVDGMEVANAFTELNDPLEQRARFHQQLEERVADEEVEIADEDFLQALEYGMPPTGGLGIGIDRLVMLLTGQQSVREVILFPQLKTKE